MLIFFPVSRKTSKKEQKQNILLKKEQK